MAWPTPSPASGPLSPRNQKTRGLFLASNAPATAPTCSSSAATRAATSDRASPPSKPMRRAAATWRGGAVRQSARAAFAPRSRGRAAARGPRRRRRSGLRSRRAPPSARRPSRGTGPAAIRCARGRGRAPPTQRPAAARARWSPRATRRSRGACSLARLDSSRRTSRSPGWPAATPAARNPGATCQSCAWRSPAPGSARRASPRARPDPSAGSRGARRMRAPFYARGGRSSAPPAPACTWAPHKTASASSSSARACRWSASRTRAVRQRARSRRRPRRGRRPRTPRRPVSLLCRLWWSSIAVAAAWHPALWRLGLRTGGSSAVMVCCWRHC